MEVFAHHGFASDNGQRGESLKFQKEEGCCNRLLKFTALRCTQSFIPTRKWTPELKQLKVPITCKDQAILSPPRMLACEKLLKVDKVNPLKTLDDCKKVLAI
jgi:hypothetical protein